jgi:hypothetical protein
MAKAICQTPGIGERGESQLEPATKRWESPEVSKASDVSTLFWFLGSLAHNSCLGTSSFSFYCPSLMQAISY